MDQYCILAGCPGNIQGASCSMSLHTKITYQIQVYIVSAIGNFSPASAMLNIGVNLVVVGVGRGCLVSCFL